MARPKDPIVEEVWERGEDIVASVRKMEQLIQRLPPSLFSQWERMQWSTTLMQHGLTFQGLNSRMEGAAQEIKKLEAA